MSQSANFSSAFTLALLSLFDITSFYLASLFVFCSVCFDFLSPDAKISHFSLLISFEGNAQCSYPSLFWAINSFVVVLRWFLCLAFRNLPPFPSYMYQLIQCQNHDMVARIGRDYGFLPEDTFESFICFLSRDPLSCALLSFWCF